MSILKDINHLGQLVKFPKNTTLFREGDACSGMLFVQKGSIKIMKYSEEGKEAMLYRVTPENICILSASCLIGHTSYNAEGLAESDIEGLFLTHTQFLELLNSNQTFREYIFSNLACRISDFIQKLDDIIFKTLKERLVELINKDAKNAPDNIINKTHQEIAVELGSSREVISRLLKTLEQEKVVDLSRHFLKKL